MNRFTKAFAASALILTFSPAFAGPVKLITHNKTNVESNAFIAGTIPSLHPTKPNSDSYVSWTEVRMACYGHIDDQKRCSAVIKMETDKGSPVEVGIATVNMDTGVITFKYTQETAYTVTVNGIGETTLAYKK